MIRWRRGWGGLLLAASVLYAWSRYESDSRGATLPPLPAGAHYQAHRLTADHWPRDGYIEMVGPLRPPSSEDGRTKIVVYVRIPPSERIRAVQQGGETWSIELPSGARADRVEYYGEGPRDAAPSSSWRVLDVRGISFEGSTQRYRVLRPTDTSGNALLGIEWPRGEHQQEVTRALGRLVLGNQLAAPAATELRERAADQLRRLNDCASCHTPYHAGRVTVLSPGIVNRQTDASGLFQVTSIFASRLPFETYRPRDMNRGDPLIKRFCGKQAVEGSATRCADGTILEGALDVAAGLRMGDLHTLRLCESRRALAAHLDDRRPFQRALDECAIERL